MQIEAVHVPVFLIIYFVGGIGEVGRRGVCVGGWGGGGSSFRLRSTDW